MDTERIKETAARYLPQMTAFLRDLIRIPSESCNEEGVIRRAAQEMRELGFDRVWIDPQGNAMGRMGTGEKLIAFDGHIDAVGIGNIDNWTNDPYEGYENDETIYGRGASDQKGGVVAAIYGVKIMKELQLIPNGYSALVVASVQEEDCDGLCWQYICGKEGVRPEFVVLTEPTDGGVYRGHRGRMEILVEARGISCHGSAPERGDNAIYKMADVLRDVRALNQNGCSEDDGIKGLVKMLTPEYNPDCYEDAAFLGRGTITASQIFYTSPSRCAVADSCSVSLDRRMTAGETWESCLEEIRALPAVKKYGDSVSVSMYKYERPSWTGLIYPTECYFPTWVNAESAPHVRAVAKAHHILYGDKRVGAVSAMARRNRPLIDKWTFSTNGVAIQGRFGIPCVGLGPGAESQAHAPNERTWKQDLVTCAAVYALIPHMYRMDNGK